MERKLPHPFQAFMPCKELTMHHSLSATRTTPVVIQTVCSLRYAVKFYQQMTLKPRSSFCHLSTTVSAALQKSRHCPVIRAAYFFWQLELDKCHNIRYCGLLTFIGYKLVIVCPVKTQTYCNDKESEQHFQVLRT